MNRNNKRANEWLWLEREHFCCCPLTSMNNDADGYLSRIGQHYRFCFVCASHACWFDFRAISCAMCTFGALVWFGHHFTMSSTLLFSSHWFFRSVSHRSQSGSSGISRDEKKKRNIWIKFYRRFICWHCLHSGCSVPAFLTIRRNNDQSIRKWKHLVSIENFSINPIKSFDSRSQRGRIVSEDEKPMRKMRDFM